MAIRKIRDCPKQLEQFIAAHFSDRLASTKTLPKSGPGNNLSAEEVFALAMRDPTLKALAEGRSDGTGLPTDISLMEFELVRAFCHYSAGDPDKTLEAARMTDLYNQAKREGGESKWERTIPNYTFPKALQACNGNYYVDPREDFDESALEPDNKPAANSNPFEISNIKSISAASMGLEKPLEHEWLIGGDAGLRKGIVAGIGASGGTGKTKLQSQTAMTVASGIDCTCGILDIKLKGSALLILPEDERDQVDEIIYYTRKIVAARNSIDPSDIDLSDLYIFCGPGDFRFLEHDHNTNLKATAAFNTLFSELLPSIPNLLFIGIDPISKVFGSIDENSNSDATFFTTLIGQLKKAAPEATILLSIHTNKSSTTAIDSIDKIDNALHQNAVRGASAFVNDLRWLMTCISVPEPIAINLGAQAGERLVAWRVAKSNYSTTTSIRYMSRGEGGVLLPFKAPDETDEIDRIVGAIGELGLKVTRRTAPDHLYANLGMTKATIRRLINSAISIGKLNEVSGLNTQNRKVLYLETWLASGTGEEIYNGN